MFNNLNNNLHEKATLYWANDLWAYDYIEARNVSWHSPNTDSIIYTVRNKRKQLVGRITKTPIVILEGWGHPSPPPKFDQPKDNLAHGYTAQTTRIPAGSPIWHVEFDAFLSNYLERSKARVLLDLRHRNGKNPSSGAENHKLCQVVQRIPPDAAKRHWKLRADYRCAGGSHWHGKVSLSESPLYLELDWHSTANEPTENVGIFRLDLIELLRCRHIRLESEDSHCSDVRLRVFRADDGNFYVQINQDEPPLFFANVNVPSSYASPDASTNENALDDLSDAPEGSQLPDRATVITNVIKRDNRVRAYVLERAKGRCEFCHVQGFLTANGEYYLEAHHIISLCDSGRDTVENVIALCPQHHRQAHYGVDAESLETEFINILRKLTSGV